MCSAKICHGQAYTHTAIRGCQAVHMSQHPINLSFWTLSCPAQRLCLALADNPLDLASGAFDTAFCGLTPHIVLDGRPFARGFIFGCVIMVRTAIVVLKGCTLEYRRGLRRQAHVVTHLVQYSLPSWAAGTCRWMKCYACVL